MLQSVKATQSISVGIHATHTWYMRPMLQSVKATQSISVGIHATHTWYMRPTLSTYTLRYMSPTRVHVHVTGPNEYIHATHTWYMSYILTVPSTFTMCKWFDRLHTL